MKEIVIANMADGPQLYSFRHNLFFYGAHKILMFTELDRGRKLTVTVDSQKPICWVELWPFAYDGKDWVRWTTERGECALVRTGNEPQINPCLTWTIQPGVYTLYFVNSSHAREPRADIFTCHIEVI